MFTLHYDSLMIGKAYVWKPVTDSAWTAELGRSFQIKGDNKWKKGKLISIGASMSRTTRVENVNWVRFCTPLYIMVAVLRCRRTLRLSQLSECCIDELRKQWINGTDKSYGAELDGLQCFCVCVFLFFQNFLKMMSFLHESCSSGS